MSAKEILEILKEFREGTVDFVEAALRLSLLGLDAKEIFDLLKREMEQGGEKRDSE